MAKTVEDIVKQAKAEITEIDVAKAKELLDVAVTFVDVREPPEWAKGTITGALQVPRGLIEWKVSSEAALADRSAPVVVYCQGGGRSALAAKVMQDMGFEQVMSLKGGYGAWSGDN